METAPFGAVKHDRRVLTGGTLNSRNGDRSFRSGEAKCGSRLLVVTYDAAMETAPFGAVKVLMSWPRDVAPPRPQWRPLLSER